MVPINGCQTIATQTSWFCLLTAPFLFIDIPNLLNVPLHIKFIAVFWDQSDQTPRYFRLLYCSLSPIMANMQNIFNIL